MKFTMKLPFMKVVAENPHPSETSRPSYEIPSADSRSNPSSTGQAPSSGVWTSEPVTPFTTGIPG